MKVTKHVSLLFLGILMSANSFGMGPKPPQELDYSALQGHFQAAPSDECKDQLDFDLLADPTNHRVTMKYSAPENHLIQFEKINQGRVPFDSCPSDGLIGYEETTGSGTKIIYKTVFLNRGIFCSGGWEKSRQTWTFELKGDTVTLDYENTEDERGDSHCIYRRK